MKQPSDGASGGEKWMAALAAVLASSLGFIDGTILPVAMPAIRADLGAGFVASQWIANGYMLFLSALVLVGGAAGDRFGVRDVFVAGIVLFTLASVGCAIAGTTELLILFRCIQGIGAAVMVPGSLALIAQVFPASERGRAIGLWSTLSGLSPALGPILGGYLIETGGPAAWRMIFWINLPLAAIAIGALLFGVRRSPAAARGPIDWLGAVLATASLGLLAYGLTLAAEGVSRALVAGLAVVVGLGLGAMFVRQQKRTPHAMLPLALFRSRVFRGANLLTFFLYLALGGVLYFLPITLIDALHLPESQAGAVFLPFTLAMAIVAPMAGAYADAHGPRLPIALGCCVVSLAFSILTAAVAYDLYALGVLPAMTVLGIGMGLVVPPLSTAVMGSATDDTVGAASGINNGVARVAGLFAVTVFGIVAALVYALMIDPQRVPGGYGAPAFGLSEASERLRSGAMIMSFVVVGLLTAAMAGIGAMVTMAMLPEGRIDQGADQRP
jgi:EmrB/QacA subfamily drug resistance transporter